MPGDAGGAGGARRAGDGAAAAPAPPGAPAGAPPAALFFAAIPMSVDHNAREPRERARLAKEHPGEADIVVCKKDAPTACYVKGRLQPTRALGDAYLKAAAFNAPPGRLWGRHIREPYSPPYVSAVPEVRVQALRAEGGAGGAGGGAPPAAGWWAALLGGGGRAAAAPARAPAAAFLILACDGVWDVLTNEEAAAFVARAAAAGAAAAAAAHADALAEGAGAAAARAAARAAADAHVGAVAERLSAWVLARTAAAEGVPTRALLALKPGKAGRRDVHDDITVVVAFVGGVDSVVDLGLGCAGGGEGGEGAAAGSAAAAAAA